MRTTHGKFALTLATLTGGLLAAAFLPIAVATADTYDFTPDITSFVPTQGGGFPPLIDELVGTEKWNLFDATTNAVFLPDAPAGTDTLTTIGSFTNNDFVTTTPLTLIGSTTFNLPVGSELDLANFGAGFENEWLEIFGGPNAGISDLLITPFGDFEVLGTGFSELSAILSP
jgi:hypothetical protein